MLLHFSFLIPLSFINVLILEQSQVSSSWFPCCVLLYFSLVFVVKHSRRWWLHIGGSKMLAPHFKDEIAGLQKWLFLAGFDLFWCSFFYCDPYLWANHVYFAKKLSPDVFSWQQGGSKHFIQCTMCILGTMFTFQPNKLRHILKVASW